MRLCSVCFCDSSSLCLFFFFFFNDTATTEIYTLSLHDVLPIYHPNDQKEVLRTDWAFADCRDRKSTRLNSSHGYISYAVFCLKKKKKKDQTADTAQQIHSVRRDRSTHNHT